MADPQTVLDAIARALRTSGKLPEVETFLTQETDLTGQNAMEWFPLVEITSISTIRTTEKGTSFVGWVFDDDNHKIGAIYDANFNMTVQIDAYDAAAGTANPVNLGTSIRRALYKYDAQMRGDVLVDENGNGHEDITELVIQDGNTSDQLTEYTPGLRRWTQEVDVQFYERVDTTEEYGPAPFIRTVNYPHAGDFAPGQHEDVEIEYTPSLHPENEIAHSDGDVQSDDTLLVRPEEVLQIESPAEIDGTLDVGGEARIVDFTHE